MTYIDEVESILPFCDGVTAGLRIRRRHMSSTIEQTIRFYQDPPRIDFETEVDWKERHQLMKVAFPVDVNSDKATYDIQFGTTERPTHSNTSWDTAKFEVCAHKFADLSDGGYGISLLTDCKYGYDIKENVMRLTLLRGPVYPDPTGDVGEQIFTYSLYPHAGDWRQGDTVQEAWRLNAPAECLKAGAAGAGMLPACWSLAESSAKNAIIDTVKGAEDGDGLILRVYEAEGKRGKVQISLGFAPESVTECNLMEVDEADIPCEGSRFAFVIKPYQVRTFRLRRKGS